MKNEKGFTLIELLAVIVLLAVIMVVAVPKILDIIESSRAKAAENSIKLLKNSIKTQITSSTLSNQKFTKDGECYLFDFDNKNDNYNTLNMKNKDQYTGSITYCDDTKKFIENDLKWNSYSINNEDVDITDGLRDKILTMYAEDLKNAENYYILYYKTEPKTAVLIIFEDNFDFQLRVSNENSSTGLPYYYLCLINDSLSYKIVNNITLDSEYIAPLLYEKSYRLYSTDIQLVSDEYDIEYFNYPKNIDKFAAYKPNFKKIVTQKNYIKVTPDQLFNLPKSVNGVTCNNYFTLTYGEAAQYYCLTEDSSITYNSSNKSFTFNNPSKIYQLRIDEDHSWEVYLTNNHWDSLVNNNYKNNDILDIINYSTFDIKDSNNNVVFSANTTLDRITEK